MGGSGWHMIILYCFIKENKSKYQQNGSTSSNGSKHPPATQSDVLEILNQWISQTTFS